MSARIVQPFMSLLTVTSILLVVQINNCFCLSHESANASVSNSFSPAVATFYVTDSGSTSGGGGGCGYSDQDMAQAPYYGLTAAGNQNLYMYGKACGSCYQVRCTENPQCSGYPITVTITNECPGACNNERIHFDLSQKAFGYLAKPGQANALLKAGRINVQYQRVQCYYRENIKFKVDLGSNRYYLAFAIENVNGDGDLGFVEILPSNSNTWRPMQISHGAVWKVDVPGSIQGPYSVRMTSADSRRTVVAYGVIPANWAPGHYYYSRVNF